jgi:hypothetical protein
VTELGEANNLLVEEYERLYQRTHEHGGQVRFPYHPRIEVYISNSAKV